MNVTPSGGKKGSYEMKHFVRERLKSMSETHACVARSEICQLKKYFTILKIGFHVICVSVKTCYTLYVSKVVSIFGNIGEAVKISNRRESQGSGSDSNMD